MFRVIERHEETSFGLPYPIVLLNAAQAEIDDNGEMVGIHIPNLEGLVVAIAISRCLTPVRLDGREVRFIRRAIGKTAKDFAADIELDASTYSRWENGKQQVGAWADKQVMHAAVAYLKDKAPEMGADIRMISEMRFVSSEPIQSIEAHLTVPDECEQEPAERWDANLDLAA